MKKEGEIKIKKIIDVLFYTAIVVVLIVILVVGGKAHNGFHLFGYSGFTVLSGSMQREIPEGSLVITKKVDPLDIKVGDDITFIRDDNITITHRVVNIIEDFQGSGMRGFQTKGIENSHPDPDVVYEYNVIGLVKYSIPELGYWLGYISKHVWLVFLIPGGILAASISFGKAFSKKRICD